MLLRRNDTATVEITALAAGAGPPANRMATRRMFDSKSGGLDRVLLMSHAPLKISTLLMAVGHRPCLFDEGGADAGFVEGAVIEDFLVQGDGRFDPLDAQFPSAASCTRSPHAGSAGGRSTFQSANRSRARRRSLRGCANRTGRRTRRHAQPGDRARRGTEVLSVSSALMRHSIATPRWATSSWRKGNSSPAATRNCALIRSMPVTISVTGCSTWMRAFTSMK